MVMFITALVFVFIRRPQSHNTILDYRESIAYPHNRIGRNSHDGDFLWKAEFT